MSFLVDGKNVIKHFEEISPHFDVNYSKKKDFSFSLKYNLKTVVSLIDNSIPQHDCCFKISQATQLSHLAASNFLFEKI